jgi:hypothetical protein
MHFRAGEVDYARPAAVVCFTRNDGFAAAVWKRGKAQAGEGIVDVSAAPSTSRLRVLRYGRTWRGGGFLCVSRRTGMTCESLLSGHGFFLSRHTYDLF